MWYFFFYLVSICGPIKGFFSLLAFCSAIAGVITFMIGHTEDEDIPIVWGKKLLVTAIIATFVHSIVPSKQDMLLIAAGGAIGTFVSNNKDAQALPADVVRWMHSELKSATDELNPVVQENKKKLEALDKEELVKQLLAAQESLK